MHNFVFDHQTLNRWYKQDLGQQLSHLMADECGAIFSNLFGDYLLEMGNLDSTAWTKNCLVHRHIRVFQPDEENIDVGLLPTAICADVTALPIATSSVDVAFLPHILEFYPEPEKILKEINTVLKPSGQIVILAFNAMSLWRFFHWSEKNSPWNYARFSATRTRTWLLSHDFEIYTDKSIFFELNQNSRFELLGRLCCPSLGGIRIIVAKKNMIPLTLIKKPAWLLEKKLLNKNSVAGPATNIRCEKDYEKN